MPEATTTVTREDVSLVLVNATTRGAESTGAALKDALGLTVPDGPRTASAGDITAVGLGVNRWLLVAPAGGGWDLERKVMAATAGSALATDQTDARTVFRLQGPLARPVLASAQIIDFHPDAFPPGTAAATELAHVSAYVWCTGADDFRIAVLRSMEDDFEGFLHHAIAAR